MTWTAPEITRTKEPRVGTEREIVEGYLDWHRQTLLHKCAGLTADQLKLASVQPSTLTLLGLVRHMAEVERWWFRTNALGEPETNIYCSDGNEDGDFDDVPTADAEADYATFLAEVESARKAVADLPLDHRFTSERGTPMTLRWVFMHMVEEYARHNGHADLLRQRIDGVVGG